jgi:hypothetical protein
MIKNCIIHRIKDGLDLESRQEKRASEISLRDCLEAAAKTKKRRLEALSKNAKNESFSVEGRNGGIHRFSVSCEFKTRKLTASGSAPFVPVKFPVWLRPKERSAVTFDAGRRLSEVGMNLISCGLGGDPSLIEGVKVNNDDFKGLREWVRSSGDGKIRQVNLKNVTFDDVLYKQIQLTADDLEESGIFPELLESATVVSSMSLVTPKLTSTGRGITCRMNRWGGVSIYTPALLDVEVSELLSDLVGKTEFIAGGR